MSSWLWTALKMLLFVETFCTLEEWVGPWEVGWGRCHLYRSWTQSQNVAPRETMKISRRTKSTKIKISLEPVCVSSCRHQSCPSGMLQVVLPPLPPWQTQEEAWLGSVLRFTKCLQDRTVKSSILFVWVFLLNLFGSYHIVYPRYTLLSVLPLSEGQS